MILKGLAVDEEAVSVVEMEGTAVQISGRLRGGWAGPGWVVGPSGLGCGKGMGLGGGWCGGIEAGCHGTNGITGEVLGKFGRRQRR